MSQHPYTRGYFEDGQAGYKLYRDFLSNYKALEVILERKPSSVLELGCARGYVVKKLEDHGVKAVGIDVSEHAWHTRCTDSLVLADATITPWKFKDKEYDLCYSKDFLEHLPEDRLPSVIKEIERVCKRGLHAVTFSDHPHAKDDPSHLILQSKEWWIEQFKRHAPTFPVEILNKEELEVAVDIGKYAPSDGLVKLNVGCFLDCFHFGWENWDIQDLTEWAKQSGYVFKQVDVTKGIPKPDNSTDIILASHFLEHVDRAEGLSFLKECFRVLKPNGLLRLAVPDPIKICDAYLKGKILDYGCFNIGVEKASDEAEALFHLLIAGHKTLYDAAALQTLLQKLSFTHVEVKPFNRSQSKEVEIQTIGMYPTLSCYIEGKKLEVKQEISSKAKPKLTSDSKLKIALISTPYFTTPPSMYGGLEMIVADLGEALAEMGHDVTVFAADGSKIEGCKIVEFGPPLMNVNIDWLQAERKTYEIYKDHLKDFNIIHASDWFGFEYLAKAKNPQLKVVHSHHGGLNLEFWKRSPPPFKLNMVAISDFMVKVYASQGFTAKRCYNGIDLQKYRLQKKKGSRLLFLGRISKIKAPHVAIEVAKKANMGLDVVGATIFVDDPSYVEHVKSLCDGEQIKFIGEVSHADKLNYLQNAKALIVPSTWGEPFGLHVVESLAVGTSVLAFPDGGIAETVKQGGILCSDVDSMVNAIPDLVRITPAMCRKNSELFSRTIMAENYVRRYNEILSGNEW